jgi:hypothetical protein
VLLYGETPVTGAEGEYCSRTCRYDAEVLDEGRLPRRRDS